MDQGSGCGCVCHKSTGLLIILIGATFLAGAFNVISERLVSIVWPILLIIAGAMKLCGPIAGCCKPK
jgi:hypothetical protein